MTEYLVVQRRSLWWVLIDGADRGPFIRRQAAVDGAIALARQDFKIGAGASVAVEIEDGFTTIYDTTLA